jgi:hypothetical protein
VNTDIENNEKEVVKAFEKIKQLLLHEEGKTNNDGEIYAFNYLIYQCNVEIKFWKNPMEVK